MPALGVYYRCPKCEGKGKLPYVDSSGRTWSNMWVTCECSQDNPADDKYQPTYPEDFDFPCSEDFREYYARLSGVAPLPRNEPLGTQAAPPVLEKPKVEVFPPEKRELLSMRQELNWLKTKLTERKKRHDNL